MHLIISSVKCRLFLYLVPNVINNVLRVVVTYIVVWIDCILTAHCLLTESSPLCIFHNTSPIRFIFTQLLESVYCANAFRFQKLIIFAECFDLWHCTWCFIWHLTLTQPMTFALALQDHIEWRIALMIFFIPYDLYVFCFQIFYYTFIKSPNIVYGKIDKYNALCKVTSLLLTGKSQGCISYSSAFN